MKVCTKCGLAKSKSEFHRDAQKADLLNSACKPCKNHNYHRRKRRSPEEMLDHRLKHLYGMTLEEFREREAEVSGLCEICGEPNPSGRLHVDHCHETGEVRGLLCRHCNPGLGNFKDSTEYLRQAIAYLEKSRSAIELTSTTSKKGQQQHG